MQMKKHRILIKKYKKLQYALKTQIIRKKYKKMLEAGRVIQIFLKKKYIKMQAKL